MAADRNESVRRFSSNAKIWDYFVGNYFIQFQTQPVKCGICDMTLNSQTVFETHVTGKTHKKNLAIKNGEIPDPKLWVHSAPGEKSQQEKSYYLKVLKVFLTLDITIMFHMPAAGCQDHTKPYF